MKFLSAIFVWLLLLNCLCIGAPVLLTITNTPTPPSCLHALHALFLEISDDSPDSSPVDNPCHMHFPPTAYVGKKNRTNGEHKISPHTWNMLMSDRRRWEKEKSERLEDDTKIQSLFLRCFFFFFFAVVSSIFTPSGFPSCFLGI